MTPFRFDAERAKRKPRDYQRGCQRGIARALSPHTPALLHIATGGGKTFVANNALVAALNRRGGYALWVTKDWVLLEQAADDLAARHRGMESRLARLGGSGNAGDIALLPEATNVNGFGVIYTTLHTFKRRLDQGRLPRRNPSLIIWDECHWGYAAATGKALLKWARTRHRPIPVLGLTATPRHPDRFKTACRHTFNDLVNQGYLAEYKLVPRRTDVLWSPQRSGEHGDFTSTSLDKLARSRRRNNLIVNEYVSNAPKYGKTVIFACNIWHARLLAHRLKEAGVAARPLDSQLPASERQETLRRFSSRSSEIRVLINVALLTHGVDVPDIKTVFLCRPTASDILFSQMVGRGARRLRGKKQFNLVEFTDNADRFLPEVVTAEEFLGVSGDASPNAYRGNRRWRHRFDPFGAPAWTGIEGPEEVRNLWYLEGQTFGVEFELTADVDPEALTEREWLTTARQLLAHLRSHLGSDRVRRSASMAYHTGGYTKWKVEYDSSVGWEVISPVLQGRDGLMELAQACGALTAAAADLGLRVNYRTGTHVHIGWIADQDRAVRALRLVHLLEPMLRSLVPPSRFAHYDPDEDRYDPSNVNIYCQPVSSAYPIGDFDEQTTMEDLKGIARDLGADARNVTFNPTPLWEAGSAPHVEVRLLGGTTEAEKLLPWISLWMRLLWVVGQDRDHLLGYDLSDPAANFSALEIQSMLDIISLPDENAEFTERLRRRQSDIFRKWRKYKELHAWLPTRQRRTRGRRQFMRSLENIARTLEEHQLPNTVGSFLKLDEQGRLCALWCVLLGEGALPADRDSTIRLCAERLRSAGWADYQQFRRDGRLWTAIWNALSVAGSDGWFDVPGPGLIRACVGTQASTPSPANRDIDQGAWLDCVLRALSQQPNARAPRWRIGRAAFEVARKDYGIQMQNYVSSVEEPVQEAIDSAVDAGLVAIDRAAEAGREVTADNHVLILLVELRDP